MSSCLMMTAKQVLSTVICTCHFRKGRSNYGDFLKGVVRVANVPIINVLVELQICVARLWWRCCLFHKLLFEKNFFFLSLCFALAAFYSRCPFHLDQARNLTPVAATNINDTISAADLLKQKLDDAERMFASWLEWCTISGSISIKLSRGRGDFL